MGKSRTEKNYKEAQEIVLRFEGRQHLLTLAIVQMIEREKVRVLNAYRKNHGEPPLPTDPPRLPGDREHEEWLIDVPREWYSVTGKSPRQ